MADNSSQIVEDIKWFMFDDESKEIKNENGFSHGLQFVTWAGDGQCFIVKDADGTEYRIRVSKEMEWNRKSMVERIIEMNKYEEMGKANVRAFAERLKKELIKTKLVNGIEVIIEKDISTLDLFHTINSLLEEMECR